MVDIARLGFEIASNVLRQGRRDLDALAGAAGRVETASARAQREIDRQTRGIGSLGAAMRALAASAAVTSIIALTRAIATQSDEYAGITGRLKLVTTGTQQLVQVQAQLFAIAQKTGSTYKGVADLYTKVAANTKSLGLSQKQLASFVTTANEALQVGGASAEEAAGSVQQLGQALASGVLSGDEFKTLRESAPRLIKAIADGLHTTTDELGKMAEAQELKTKKVLGAVIDQEKAVADQFAQLPETVGRAITRFQNSWQKALGTGADVKPLIEAIDQIRGNLDDPHIVQGLSQVASGIVAITSETIKLVAVLGNNWADTLNAGMVLAAVLIGKVTSGLAAQAAAWTADILLINIHTVALAENARREALATTIMAIHTEAEVAAAVAEVALARAMGTTTIAIAAQTAANSRLTAATVANTTAQAAATIAAARATTAMAAATIGARVLAATLGLLRLVFTGLGGWVGVAVAAIVGFVWWYNRAKHVTEEADLGKSLRDLAVDAEKFRSGGALYSPAQLKAIDDAEAKISDLSALIVEQDKMRKDAFAKGNSGQGLEITANIEAEAKEIEQLSADIQRLRQAVQPLDDMVANDPDASLLPDVLPTSSEEQLQRVKNKLDAFLAASERAAAIMQQQHEQRLVDDATYYAALRKQIDDDTGHKIDALRAENAIIAAEKVAKDEQARNAAKISANNAQIAELLKDQTTQQTLLDGEAAQAIRDKAKAMAEYNAQLAVTLAAQKLQHARDLQDATASPSQRRFNEGRRPRDDQFADAQLDAQAQFRDTGDADKYATQTQQLIAAHQAQLEEWANYYKQIEAMQTDFGVQWDQTWMSYADSVRNVGAQVAGDLASALDSALSKTAELAANTILWGEGGSAALKELARSILTEVVTSLIRAGLQMAVNYAMSRAFGAASLAATTAQAAASATAWAPAAVAASIATFGAADTAGLAAYLSSLAIGTATTTATSAAGGLAGHQAGGYTGDVGRSTVAGFVHGQEYVLNAGATARMGRATLDAMNDGSYRPEMSAPSHGGMGGGWSGNVVVNNHGTPSDVDAHVDAAGDLIVQLTPQIVQAAAATIAADMQENRGPVAGALNRGWQVTRQRGAGRG